MASALSEASSSSSIPPPRSWTYHVFLSFSGKDTRKSFTDHLCAALERKGIKTFRDDKDLDRGEVISVELLKAIEESMFAITVISPNYASSVWCLDELQKIVECNHNLGLYVVPVFYGVAPCDVRRQKGSFEEAFIKHQQRFGGDSEKVKRWRDALAQIASYSGWDSKDQHEATLVESIAQHIHTKLIPKLPYCAQNLVGIASRLEEVTKRIGIGLSDFRFVGIWGMGGAGKTTIARAVYEAIEGNFQVVCFLADIRERCEKNGLVRIQKDLVAHIHMKKSKPTFNNVYDGQRTIRTTLCNKKVLLVLDDVSNASQLENLAGKQDWFGRGSRVIITTRDRHLLKAHEVYSTYEVECLVPNEALHLFCLKAFKRDEPLEGFFEMSDEVVKYTGGLPLALNVLGSYLYGRTVDVWHSAVKKIRSAPHSEILDTLKISYEGLDPMEKKIFLDIACFFKGEDKDKVVDILEKCDYNPKIEIDVLIERSLVTINSKSNTMDMHDLLQEMGRNIVIQESPSDPGKRSRLWSLEDIELVLGENKGTEAIQGIALRFYYKASWTAEAFLNMSQLKFLSLFCVGVYCPLNLPSSLKVLHLQDCGLQTLLRADQQYEPVEINLASSNVVQLWHGNQSLGKLKYLNLSRCQGLQQTPDLSGLPILRTLDLSSCLDLTDIHPSLIHHKNLVVLDLSGCHRLETLPGKLEMRSLTKLILDKCARFKKLPEFGECMKHLSRLSSRETAIRELPTSLACLVGLSDLNLCGSRELTCIPDSIHGLKSLRILNVSRCYKLRGLPQFIGSLPSLSILDFEAAFAPEELLCLRSAGHFKMLTDLDLSYSKFVKVPLSIHELTKLGRLRLNFCTRLKFLPELPPSIRELEAWCCYSLNTSNFNNLSNACCDFFASSSRDGGEVLQMVIPVTEIPSWFVHRQEGNSVSVPTLHNNNNNCPQSERLGIALCFLLQPYKPNVPWVRKTFHLAVDNGDKIVTCCTPLIGKIRGNHLCIFCMTNDYLSKETHLATRFELSFEGYRIDDMPKTLSSAVRWVHVEDTEDLNKSEENENNSLKKKRKREEEDLLKALHKCKSCDSHGI